MKLTQRKFCGLTVTVREGSSDENVFKEVVERRGYRKASIGFDVQPGEHWLDLGANVGAFAVYCKSRGAHATCFEPDPNCFRILQLNAPEFELHNQAVTASTGGKIDFFISTREGAFSRGAVRKFRNNLEPSDPVSNCFAGSLLLDNYQGIKMDIEGGEFDLIDQWLLPKANKLVLEYHLSADSSVPNLARRLSILKSHYRTVSYPPEFDKVINTGVPQFKSFFDRNIYAFGLIQGNVP